jgi:hypothetical protein
MRKRSSEIAEDHSCRNTDYVLVGIDKADDAMRVLENDGWTVTKSV